MDKELQIKYDAYDAVKNTLKWMAFHRQKSEEEGYPIWSDDIAKEQGLLNTAECLTTFFLANLFNEEKDLRFSLLNEEILSKDIIMIVETVEKNGFIGTPYLIYPDKNKIVDFTDTVSYVITVSLASDLMKWHNKKIEPKLKDVQKILRRAVIWLIKNKLILDDRTCGWSWLGSKDFKNYNEYQYVQTYFTYSGIISLVDILDYASSEFQDIKGEIVETIQGTKDFLINHNRAGDKGWIDFIPDAKDKKKRPANYDDFSPPQNQNPNVLHTLYAIVALCYIKNRINKLDGLVWNDKDDQVVHDGMKWIMSNLNDRLDMAMMFISHHKLWDGVGGIYIDGTTPYQLLNALSEYNKAYPKNSTEDFMKFYLNVVEGIIMKCWAGYGRMNELKIAGFKHFVERDIDSEKNKVVYYASSSAVEALLNFGVERPPTISIQDIIREEFENTEKRILERLEQLGMNIEPTNETNTETKSKNLNESKDSHFDQTLETIKTNLNEHQYDQIYAIKVQRENMGQKDLDKYATFGRKANVDELFNIINKNYNESNSKIFKDNVKTFEKGYSTVLFEPQKNAISILKNLLDNEISNERIRKTKIIDSLKILEKDIVEFIDKGS